MVDTSSSSVYFDPDVPKNTATHTPMGTPGTPDFFLSLLEYIRTSASSFPLDPVIFQSVILCVMVGNKHLLLRTREEDIPIVQNLAALVSDPVSRAVHRGVNFSDPGSSYSGIGFPRLFPSLAYGMSSSCLPDFHQSTRLHNPQTQDSIFVGYCATIFRPINILFISSRSSSADEPTGLPFQGARETSTLSSHLRRSRSRGQ